MSNFNERVGLHKIQAEKGNLKFLNTVSEDQVGNALKYLHSFESWKEGITQEYNTLGMNLPHPR